MFTIQRLIRADEEYMESIVRLLSDQSVSGEIKTLTREDFTCIFENPGFIIFLVEDNSISPPLHVGMASLFFQRTVGRYIAEMHDMVVATTHRRRGIGDLLTKELIKEVKCFALAFECEVRFMLTSRPARKAANLMYQKHGFKLIARAEPGEGTTTNLYQMIVRP